MEKSDKDLKLKRKISLLGVIFIGVGNILGAGIYVLVGTAVGMTGNFTWIIFVFAAFLAILTGLSYAELSAMYPKSAAEYVYTEEAFGSKLMSFVLGWVIILLGFFAAATVALGFSYYFTTLLSIPTFEARVIVASILIVLLSIISYLGIEYSSRINIVFVLIEVTGLIIIIIIGIPEFGSVNYFEFPAGVSFLVIFSATALIFFAYIGFEDIANVAEEVKNPHKNLPKAIVYSSIITTIIYILVAIAIVSVLPWDQIAASDAPLMEVASVKLGNVGFFLLAIIALFATSNTVLIMLIVTSRQMYGMSKDKVLPEGLSKLSPKRRTPYLAVWFTMIFTIIPIIFMGILEDVAHATVFAILIAFFLVNLSLIVLRKKKPDLDRPFKIKPNIKWVPIIPLLGCVVCATFIILYIFTEPLIVIIELISIAIGIVFYVVWKLIKSKTD